MAPFGYFWCVLADLGGADHTPHVVLRCSEQHADLVFSNRHRIAQALGATVSIRSIESISSNRCYITYGSDNAVLGYAELREGL